MKVNPLRVLEGLQVAPEKGGKPEIIIDVDEERVVAQALEVLARDADVFQRGGHLVHVLAEVEPTRRAGAIAREDEAPRIALMPEPWVRVHLAAAASWKRQEEKRLVSTHPPDWVVRAVATAGRWPGLRSLIGITESPVLRPDGSVLSEPGYDEATGLSYRPQGAPASVPERPTKAEATAALGRLLDVVRDFPFELPEHRSSWVAAVLTPFCRWAFEGPAPLFLFDANVRGAGKSLLARITAIIAHGRTPATMTLPAEEDERRKRITAIALAGDPLVLLDNIEGVLGGAALNAALTSTSWADRILGMTQTTGALPLLTVWFATGNNAALGADTTRRTLQIRLLSGLEKPEERSGFAHPDLLAYVRRERVHLVEAALTLARAYFVDGAPPAELPAMGSFEGWSLVRRIVTWAGLPDPLRSQVALAEEGDREAAELRGLHAGLAAAIAWKGRPVAAREVLEFAATPDGEALRDVLLEHLGGGAKGELPTARRLAGRLRHFKGRMVGTAAIVPTAGRSGTDRWSLRDGGFGGDGGSSNPYARADARAHTHTRAGDGLPESNQGNQTHLPGIGEAGGER